MTEITAVNEAAKAQGMSYGQYVLRNEEPVVPEPEEEEEVILCAVCGKPLPPRDEEGKTGRKRMYCSKACRQKASRDRKKAAESVSQPEQLCPECGGSFRPRKTLGTPQKFCCTACRNRFNSREYWRKKHPKKEEDGMEKDRDVQFTHSEPETVEEQLEKALQTELAMTAGSPSSDLTSLGHLPPVGEGFVPEQEKKHDPVNHPSHYTQGGVECKDAIRAAVTGLEGYEAFLTGNAIKYLWRWKRKNGAEDLRKAGFWIRELIRELEERNEENT